MMQHKLTQKKFLPAIVTCWTNLVYFLIQKTEEQVSCVVLPIALYFVNTHTLWPYVTKQQNCLEFKVKVVLSACYITNVNQSICNL